MSIQEEFKTTNNNCGFHRYKMNVKWELLTVLHDGMTMGEGNQRLSQWS